MSEKIVMGYWDCPYCGTNKIQGITHDCPNCGRQRGKETRFYMDENHKEYIDHTVEGADWYCEYCGALNKTSLNVCENCASPKSESKQDYFSFNKDRQNQHMSAKSAADKTRPSQSKSSETKSLSSALHESNIEHKYSDYMRDATPEENKSVDDYIKGISKPTGVNFWKLTKSYSTFDYKRIGLLALIPLFIILMVLIFKPRTNIMHVTDVRWTNTIDVEELRTFDESDWHLPSGGRLKYTRSEIRRYEKVLDHYDSVTKSRQVQDGGHYEHDYSDNGDGTFTEHERFVPDYKTEYYTEQEPVYRDEPVYDTKYYYEIDKWIHSRNVTTTDNDKKPYWGDLNLKDKEREGKRNTKYTISGTINKGKKIKDVSYTVDKTTWQELNQPVDIKITTVAGTLKEWEFVE